MSKKSRRRNKRLLGALAALGGAAMLGRRRKSQANVEMDLPMSNTFSKPNMADVAGAVSQPKTIASPVITKKRNPKSIYISDDGSITKGDMSFANKNEYSNFMRKKRKENAPLGGLRVPGQSMASPNMNTGAFDIGFKNGGTVVKTGEKTIKAKKKKSIQIRGFGKARR